MKQINELIKWPDYWNVRIFEVNHSSFDQLYCPYIEESMLYFDELEGYFYHKDYDNLESLKEEDCKWFPIGRPIQKVHIKNGDCVSISVSLINYVKMIKKEISFPKGISNNRKIEELTCLIEIPKEIKAFLNYNKKHIICIDGDYGKMKINKLLTNNKNRYILNSS